MGTIATSGLDLKFHTDCWSTKFIA